MDSINIIRNNRRIHVEFKDPDPKLPNFLPFITAVLIMLVIVMLCFLRSAKAEDLKASWYSIESLKKEGTFKLSKGVMANGKSYNENSFTCATRLYRLNTVLYITNLKNGRTVIVKVTDRIGKRFANSRIDLSKGAFMQIADLKEGIVPISVEVMHD